MIDEKLKFINIRLKDTLLEELDLPNIEYPIPTYIFSESLETDNIPFGAMLFGLQNIDVVTPEIVIAKNKLAELLSPYDNREIITACGEDWWLELGPVNMDKEMVTIQQNSDLIGAIQPRGDGRLLVATYRMLDKNSLSILLAASIIPHPQFGVHIRKNNWEYIKDNAALISNTYADMRGEPYLSYWKIGLGIGDDKSIVDVWYSQRKLKPIRPQITATEIGVYHTYREFNE